MIKKYLIIIFAAIILFACKKESPKNGGDNGGGTNNTKLQPSCSPKNNSFTSDIFSAEFIKVNCGPGGNFGIYEMSAASVDGSVTVMFPGNTAPTSDKEYKVSTACPTPALASDEVCIIVTTGSPAQDYQASAAKVYVNIVNGVLVATICDMTFFSQNFKGTAKLTCN